MSKGKEYTADEFALKFKLSRSTVYRWMSSDIKRFKMYDAEVVEVHGRKIVKVTENER